MVGVFAGLAIDSDKCRVLFVVIRIQAAPESAKGNRSGRLNDGARPQEDA